MRREKAFGTKLRAGSPKILTTNLPLVPLFRIWFWICDAVLYAVPVSLPGTLPTLNLLATAEGRVQSATAAAIKNEPR
jgi:hypothetical protein